MGNASKVFISRLSSTLILWTLCGITMSKASETGFWILLSALILRGLWEFFSMLTAAQLPHLPKTGMLLGTLLCIGSLFVSRTWGNDTAILFESAFLALSVLTLFIQQMAPPRASQSAPHLSIAPIAYTLLGIAYIPFLASFTSKLIYLTPRTPEGTLSGHYYVLFLVVVTKFSDCGAYLSGSLLGKHLMIPHISPKKTWEGFCGALALSMLGAWGLVWLFPHQLALLSPTAAILLALPLSLIAVLGDLAESIVKRSTGIKDSGHFLPGIGGSMDLIDSILFTGPILYFYLRASLLP